ncbi:MAG: Cof-type HAD-IIB family hydrolase [Streptosporangiales bacterium]|nr:Cof-type HAD-IIB family hydrolase [Streptosporangiales bacterium]
MPPRPPRLVATDLDGTLLRTDRTVSPYTHAVLAAVEAAGAEVVFVTGRPPRWMDGMAEHAGEHGLAVCSNGALVVDLRHEEILTAHPMAPDLLAHLVDVIDRAVPKVAFAAEYGWDFAAQADYRAVEPHEQVDLATLTSRPAAKLLAKHPDGDSDALLARLTDTVGTLATCTHSGFGSGLVEISAYGVTKASAVAALCAERGIDAADVVAFGDMPNDLEMLRWAGRSYAMRNAHPDVLDVVTARAPTNDDDGVARTLAALFDLAEPSHSLR